MGDQQEALKHKLQHECDYEPPKNVQKRDSNNELAIATEPRSITNIYYDCLERIFDLLDLKSLLYVAQTCKRLQVAAAVNFNDRYGREIFVLMPKNLNDDFKGFRENNDYIYVVDMQFCLPLLRCFGSKILHLHVWCTDAHPAYDYVDSYINFYSADTLNSILYTGRDGDFLNELFIKPFKKVETVYITHSNAKQLPNFDDWFPNLRQLKIDGCSIRRSIPANLPLLNHLSIAFACDLVEKCVEDLLHANEQLQCLKLFFRNDIKLKMSTLLKMIRKNTSISKLTRYDLDNKIIDVNEDELLQLASEHPEMIELHLSDCLLKGENAIRFFGQLNSLKWFQFRIKERFEYDQLVTNLDSNWGHEYLIDENNTTQYIITLKK